jgi:hypothetical protein
MDRRESWVHTAKQLTFAWRVLARLSKNVDTPARNARAGPHVLNVSVFENCDDGFVNSEGSDAWPTPRLRRRGPRIR